MLIIALPLLSISALFVVMNWVWVIMHIRNKMKGIPQNISTVPLISLIFGYMAFTAGGYKKWYWIVPMLDIGNWILIIAIPYLVIRAAWEKMKKKCA